MIAENKLINDDVDKIVIPWSGGVDSTAIIFKLIDEINDIDDDRQPIIYLLSAVNMTNKKQCKSEKQARKLIYSYIKENYPKIYKRMKLVKCSEELSGWSFSEWSGQQSFWWLCMVMKRFGSNTAILFGYIAGDSFWYRLDKFHNLINAMNEYHYYDVHRYVYYPLMYESKREVYDMLPDEIKPLVSYCTNSDVDEPPCGECPSCKTHIAAIGEIK